MARSSSSCGRSLAAMLAVVALAAGCGGVGAARDGAPMVGPDAVDPRWLAPLELPDLRGAPLIAVDVLDADGEGAHAALLLSDHPDRFVAFDGLATETFARWDDAKEGLPVPRGLRLATFRAIRGPELAAILDRELGLADVRALRRAVFATALAERGQRRAARELTDRISREPASLERTVRELVPWYLVHEAVHGYAAGGTAAVLRRELARAARLEGTAAATAAREMLAALDLPAPATIAPATGLDALIAARLTELRDRRCGDPGPLDANRQAVRGLRAMGLSAMTALEEAQKDGRLSRCIEGGPAGGTDPEGICMIDPSACRIGPPDPPRLTTMAQLASRALELPAGAPRPRDGSDLDCGFPAEGVPVPDDPELWDLVQREIDARNIASAMAVTERARGQLRAHFVYVLGIADRTPALDDFLAREAVGGPVLAARVAAARVVGKRGDTRWVRSIAPAVVAALGRDGKADRDHARCDDPDLVSDGLAALLDQGGRDGVAAIESAFASLGPHARLRVLVALSLQRSDDPAVRDQRDRIFRAALADTRRLPLPVALHLRSSLVHGCTDFSPSDLAGVFFVHRTGVRYSCGDDATSKANAVRSIEARLARGPLPR